MSDYRIFAVTDETGAAALINILFAEMDDEDGLPVASEEVDEKAGRWEVSIYGTGVPDQGLVSRFANLAAAAGIESKIETEVFGKVDWVARSLEGLKPVRAGRFLVHGAHDRDARRPGDLAIEIEAGQAFGTGHHGTTAGCLEMIERVLRAAPGHGARLSPVLDLGTGSGVLAIAAAMRSPIRVLATDIDPVATAVARINVRHNHVSAQVRCETAPGFHHPAFAQEGPFGLIIANILARPLMRMAPHFARQIRPGGTLILSGILAGQRRQVLAAFSGQHFAHVETLWRNGWVTLRLRR